MQKIFIKNDMIFNIIYICLKNIIKNLLNGGNKIISLMIILLTYLLVIIMYHVL